MNLTDSKVKLLFWGVLVGILAAILAVKGNPGNMAFCIACFLRDTAGAMKLHTAAVVQYARPETIGIVIGAFIISIINKDYRSTAGSSPMVRFVLGMILAIGSLVFLGCPLRMVIRMAAGDYNAWIALIGFVAGVFTATQFLKKGYSLGRAHYTNPLSGAVPAVLMTGIFILSIGTGIFAVSEKGPGSMHAPIAIALIVGILVGVIAELTRMCFAGSVRDIFIVGSFDLFSIILGLFVTLLVFNISSGRFNPGFTGQPVAHSQHLWSILSMYAVGFAAVLAGGCPMRQLVLSGQGSSDAGVTVVGMFIGAALAHNWALAGAPATAEKLGGPGINGKVATIICIVLCFIIALTNKRNMDK